MLQTPILSGLQAVFVQFINQCRLGEEQMILEINPVVVCMIEKSRSSEGPTFLIIWILVYLLFDHIVVMLGQQPEWIVQFGHG